MAVQGPALLVLLFDEQRQFYFTDFAGNVGKTATPTPVRLSPDGLREVSIINERNKRYWGLDRTFTVPLKWVLDGAKIIKTIHNTQGPEGKVGVMLLELTLEITATEYDWVYRRIYIGEPDLSTYVHEGPVVTTNVITGGLEKLIKAAEGTVLEVPVDVPNATLVNMDGIPLHETGNLFLTQDLEYKYSDVGDRYLPSIVYTGSDGQSTGILFASTSVTPMGNVSFPDKVNSLNWFVRNTGAFDVSIRLHGTQSVYINKNDTQSGFRLRLLTSMMTLQDQDKYRLHANSFVGVPGSVINIPIDVTFVLRPGENGLIEIIDQDTGPINNIDIIFKDYGFGALKAEFVNKYPATKIKALDLLDVANVLVAKIGGQQYSVKSTILTNNKKVKLTSGDAMRGLPGSVIKLSLSEFFDGVTLIPGIGPIGMGVINEQLVIEPLAFWLAPAPADVVDLGDVADFKHSQSQDFLYGTIKVGYPDQDYDSVNGRDEPNNALLFSSQVQRSNKELNLVSPWRADSYGIEFIRVNLDGKTTTDSASDNDKILLATDGAGNLDRSLNAGATGLLEPEGVFNLPLSPKRIFYAWEQVIRSFMRGLENTSFKFESSYKNSKLVCGGIKEADNVVVGSLKKPLFYADTFDFQCPAPRGNTNMLIRATLKQYTFRYQGVPMRGIPLRSGLQPGAERTQVYQLLAHPDTDFTTLIDIDE